MENDIIHDLKKYAHHFDAAFTDNIAKCDVVLTNDVFTEQVLASKKPLVKRMDGIFFQTACQDRNTALNLAATQADHVIFISEFSRNSYFQVPHTPLRSHSVVLNAADHTIFKPGCTNSTLTRFAANATSWARSEKRFQDLMSLASVIPEEILLIGDLPEHLAIPDNVTPLGYRSDYHQVANILRSADGFINFSYRDAAPKTVCQALACGLPVLFAGSGGVPELVPTSMGVSVEDPVEVLVEDATPLLDQDAMMRGYFEYKAQYPALKAGVRGYNVNYLETLSKYFAVLHRFGSERRA